MKYKFRMKPQHILNIVHVLSDKAKAKIKKLKFGSMLKIKLDDFPNGLIVDLMDCCEVTPEGVKLVVGEYKIMVTPQLVKDVLGLPLGKDDVVIEILLSNSEQKKEDKGLFWHCR